MTYTIRQDADFKINFFPGSVVEEVLQNVMVLLRTPKYSVPLDRKMGYSGTFVDKSIPAVPAMLTAELYEIIEQYEPRVRIMDIRFEQDVMRGVLTPCLEVEINGG